MSNYIRRIKMPAANAAISAGAAVQFNALPQNYIYKKLYLKLTSITKAQIAGVNLKLGSKDIIPPQMTGTQLDKINGFQGLTQNASILEIPFFQANAATDLEARLGELDTMAPAGSKTKYDDFFLQITPDAAHVGAAVELWAEIDTRAKPAVKGLDTPNLFRAWKWSQKSLAATGDNEVVIDAGKGLSVYIRQLHHFHTNITKYEMLRDTVPYYQLEPIADIQMTQTLEMKRAVQAGCFSVDFCAGGHELDAMQIVNPDGSIASMKYNLFTSAPDTAQVVADILTSYNDY